MANELTQAQKLMLFEQATKKNIHTGETVTFTEGSVKTIVIPKSRTLAKISLLVSGSFTLTHASKTTYTTKTFDKYHLLRNVRLKMNNGFTPFNLSGVELKMYNDVSKYKNVTDNLNVIDYIGNTVSSGGTSNSVSFMLDLPTTINDRDFTGLIDLQSSGINVELEMMFGVITDIMTDTDITVSNISLSVIPIYETFSIPPMKEHTPSFNTVKVVGSQKTIISGAGDTTIKLPIGLTYRKILLYLKQDGNYTPIALTRVSNISLILNQADYLMNVPAKYISGRNAFEQGVNLRDGQYSIDLSNNGIANYGSGRDYLDSEFLSELWVKINLASVSGSTNEVITITEQIAEI